MLRIIPWLLALVVGYACTRVESTTSPPPLVTPEGGFGGEATSGAGSLAGEGGEGNGGSSVSVGGAPGSVELGVWPTFTAEAQPASDADAVLAAISALAAGSDTLPIYERWDTLSGATGSPRAAAWQRLDAMIAPYAERDLDVALCIGLVDRSVPAWPVVEEVDSVAAREAIERTIDEVYLRYAPHLSRLCFGYEVDRYLAAVPQEVGERLLELLGHALDYAQRHPLWSRRISLGVAMSLAAASDPDRVATLALGHEVVAVYDPLDDDGELRNPEGVAGEIDAALDALPLDAGGVRLRLALFEAGFPSADAVGSSESAQRQYYESLFAVLDSRIDEVTFVGLFGLGDRDAAACVAEAESFGSDQETRATARCSMGLRAESGDPKAAWPSVVAALSRYR